MDAVFGSGFFPKRLISILFAAIVFLVAGCSDNTGSTSSGSVGTTGGTIGTTAVPTLVLALTDTSGTAVTTISAGYSAVVKATVKDETGAPAANAVVTFTTSLGVMDPLSGTALTNSLGVASITLTGGSTSGADMISATAQVNSQAATASIGYTVGAVSVTMTDPVFGVGSAALSAFGTTSVTVTVNAGGVPITTPQTVTFSSPCALSGKAALSTSIVTVDGVATASYRDNGCAGTDLVTASVSGITSSSATLTVTAPTVGSIQYVSSVPENISLKGTGGIEVSTVTFRVLDTGGKPVSGKTVDFGLSTTAGGITLTPAIGTATSDAEGLVVTNVNAGSISTAVRVTASTVGAGNAVLSTQSNQLSITTGIPDQYGTSLAVTTHAIEGWNYDGETSLVTARLADHFKNPVPDGTAVAFTSEGASIGSNCLTVNGACSVTFTSQAGRPSNGRVTVLATAVGEETFTDVDGDGWADKSPNELVDPNGIATDLPEAWVDYNENGVRDAYDGAGTLEPYFDFDNSTDYDATGDGKFNGVLCKEAAAGGGSSAGTCSDSQTLHVRASQVMILSSSHAIITINGDSDIDASCIDGVGNDPLNFIVTVVDENGNSMPAGTVVEYSTTNGVITSDLSYLIPDSDGCRSSFPGCPASPPAKAADPSFGDLLVTVKSDSAYGSGICTPNATTGNKGVFTVKVTSPNGLITKKTATLID